MLFAGINAFFFLLSMFIFRAIWQGSKKAQLLRAKVTTKNGEEYRYFTDYAFPLGMLYVALCALIFLFHVYAGLTQIPSWDWEKILDLLREEVDYFHFMAAMSLGNAFLIIPERSIVLPKYQFLFVVLTFFWLIWPGVLNFVK